MKNDKRDTSPSPDLNDKDDGERTTIVKDNTKSLMTDNFELGIIDSLNEEQFEKYGLNNNDSKPTSKQSKSAKSFNEVTTLNSNIAQQQ